MSNISERQQAVNDKLNEAYKKLSGFEDEQKKILEEFETLNSDRTQYAALSDVADYIDRLEKLGGGELFWGNDVSPEDRKRIINRVNDELATFDEKIQKLTDRRNHIQDQVDELTVEINELNEQTLILEEVAEEAKYEFVIEREMVEGEYRPMMMPWNRADEDDKRYRRILFIALFLAVLLGYLVPLWDVPIPERKEIEVPERLAKLMLKKEPPPPKVEKPVEKIDELKKEEKTEKKKPKPTEKKVKVARKRAENAGLLAFKENFSELMSNDVDKKLGAKAQISASGKTAKTAKRSIITSQATSGSSGGINTASLSRDVGGAGEGMKGVGFERVETSIGSDFFGEERPLSEGVGPSRTDEEIQIVFDRYKAALYRIYNRQLRKNPTLQGKMVLRITIDPKGVVTRAKVESSDMDSPELNEKIVARVKRFNFGAKEGVPTITILYPIDFLPAS